MTDNLSRIERSRLMAKVRGTNTKPELVVRSLAHSLGYRFRLHRRDLPGTPDIVFARHRKIILVHGCFWHGHGGCYMATVPKTRRRFWLDKISTNRERDARVVADLKALGWRVLVVWECQTKTSEKLSRTVRKFLDGSSRRR